MRRLGLLSCQSAQRTAGAARLGVHGGGSAAEQRGDHHEQRDARSTGFRQFEDGLDVGHLVVGGAVLGARPQESVPAKVTLLFSSMATVNEALKSWYPSATAVSVTV